MTCPLKSPKWVGRTGVTSHAPLPAAPPLAGLVRGGSGDAPGVVKVLENLNLVFSIKGVFSCLGKNKDL